MKCAFLLRYRQADLIVSNGLRVAPQELLVGSSRYIALGELLGYELFPAHLREGLERQKSASRALKVRTLLLLLGRVFFFSLCFFMCSFFFKCDFKSFPEGVS